MMYQIRAHVRAATSAIAMTAMALVLSTVPVDAKSQNQDKAADAEASDTAKAKEKASKGRKNGPGKKDGPGKKEGPGKKDKAQKQEKSKDKPKDDKTSDKDKPSNDTSSGSSKPDAPGSSSGSKDSGGSKNTGSPAYSGAASGTSQGGSGANDAGAQDNGNGAIGGNGGWNIFKPRAPETAAEDQDRPRPPSPAPDLNAKIVEKGREVAQILSEIDKLERRLSNTDNTVARRNMIKKIDVLDARLQVVGSRFDALRAGTSGS